MFPETGIMSGGELEGKLEGHLMAHVGRINVPVLIMHGSKDSVIPASSSHALFDAAKERNKYVEFQHGGHNDLFNFGALEHLWEFLAKHLVGRWQ
jgi:fermentation-respiration switch protein FrsA (DUF1100 family)